MDFEKAFATDDKLEQEGRWFPVGEGASCLIARTGNTRYKEMLRAKLGVYEASLQARLLDDDTADTMLIEVMAKTILLGWKGFEDQGEEVPYSIAAATKFLTKFKDFRNFVASNADNMQAYRVQDTEEDRGKLPAESDGSLSGAKKSSS